MSSTSSLRLSQAVLCLIAFTCLASASPVFEQQAGANIQNDRLPLGDDGSLFLAGNECGPDEQLATGQLPMCEPTCANPRPICPKVFFSGIDYVPCFCRAPLVRNQATKQCVMLSECPPQVAPQVPIQKL